MTPTTTTSDALLSTLDNKQRAAVESRARTLLVLSGPGSGKTRTLTARIVHLLQERMVPSHQVACFVFSRAAAAEVRSRVVACVGEELAALLTVSTFHAFAMRVLRACPAEYLSRVRWPEAPWRAADEAEADEALKGLFRSKGPEARPEVRKTNITAVRAASTTHAAHGRWGQGPQWDVLRLWWNRLAERRLVAHDRLIPAALAAIDADRSARRHVEDLRFVLVDEAHDLTSTEWNLACAPERAGSDLSMTVVGDARQAIYGWRGAHFFLDLLANLREGPLPKGYEIVLLERSYRCREAVAAFANGIGRVLGVGAPILAAPGESSVQQGLDRASLREVVAGLAARFGPGQVVVLARTNRECGQAAADLGPDLCRLIRREPDEALRVGTAALRLEHSPIDDAAARLLLSAMGWTEEQVRRAEGLAGAARGLWEQAGLDEFHGLAWTSLLRAPSYALDALRTALGDAWLTRTTDDLLTELGERQEADLFAAAAHDERVAVATVHAAKGREWSAVVLLTTPDWPGPRPKPDELRVLFVAATRAKCVLAILEE